MDTQAIANLFATSLSADPNVRKAGEIEIRRVISSLNFSCYFPVYSVLECFNQIGNQGGVLSSLMQIIGNDGVDPYVVVIIRHFPVS